MIPIYMLLLIWLGWKTLKRQSGVPLVDACISAAGWQEVMGVLVDRLNTKCPAYQWL